MFKPPQSRGSVSNGINDDDLHAQIDALGAQIDAGMVPPTGFGDQQQEQRHEAYDKSLNSNTKLIKVPGNNLVEKSQQIQYMKDLNEARRSGQFFHDQNVEATVQNSKLYENTWNPDGSVDPLSPQKKGTAAAPNFSAQKGFTSTKVPQTIVEEDEERTGTAGAAERIRIALDAQQINGFVSPPMPQKPSMMQSNNHN